MTKMVSVFLVLAAVSLTGAVAAAQTPAISIELANNSPNEQKAKEQLERLLKELDLSRWIFTKKVRIEQRVQPHSHPVLTLNTRSIDNDRRALTNFVHEQIHWFLTERPRDTRNAIDDMKRLYRDAPDNPGKGGARNKDSTYLHLVVCQLEFESARTLFGAEQAATLMKDIIAESQSLNLGYFWIYQQVLDDQPQLSGVIRKHKLTLPGMP
jgi:hypothetical protein